MLARRQELNLQLQQLFDVLLLALAFIGAHSLRWHATVWLDLPYAIPPLSRDLWLMIAMLPLAPLLLESQGFYPSRSRFAFWQSAFRILRSGFWLALLLGAAVLVLRMPVPHRSVLFLFAIFGTIVLLARDYLSSVYLLRQLKAGRLKEQVLLAGCSSDMTRLLDSLSDETKLRWNVVGQLDLESQPVSTLVESLHRHNVNLVIFAAGNTELRRVETAISACENEGVEAWLVADFIRTNIARPSFDRLENQPVIAFRTTPDISWALLAKACLDKIGALFGLLASLPILIFAAIGIKLTSPGPIIFSQLRSGRHGRPFKLLKLRTMSTDAEMRKAELEAFNQMTGPVFKIENDPRVTKFGAWLRRTSIDELPQLLNVLVGDMSLVGPRPLPIYETEKFEDLSHRRRLSMKPGLTCLWQISGRNKVRDFDDWVRLDLEYIDNWSLGLDIRIILRTIPVVLTGLGAR
ncbi:MAG: sugar transferase [Verrucomicrobiales bacterium]